MANLTPFPTLRAENSSSAGVEVRAVDNTSVRQQQVDRLQKVRVTCPISKVWT